MANDTISIINLPDVLVSKETEDSHQDDDNQRVPIDIDVNLGGSISVVRNCDLPSNDDQNVECIKKKGKRSSDEKLSNHTR